MTTNARIHSGRRHFWSNEKCQMKNKLNKKFKLGALNAPRLTPDHIDNQIVSEIYITGNDAIHAAASSATGFLFARNIRRA